MADEHKWAEALKINAKQLADWSALAPDGVPLIVWLLQEGHVPASEYLAWAREHYALPVVQPAYFASAFKVEEARELTANGQEEWRPWYFPVEKWDDLTLVGCVEPPAQAPGDHVRYVLADPHTLQQVWSKMADSFAEEANDEVAPPAPEVETPVGMSEGTTVKPFKLNLDLDNADLFTGTDVEAKAPAAPQIPEPQADEPLANEPLVLNIPKMAPPPPIPQAPPAAKMPEMPQMPQMPKTPAPAPAPPASAPPPPAPPKKVAAAPASNENATEMVLKAFATLTGTYEHVFVMKCANGVAKLYKWDANLKPQNGGKNAQVDLAFPTFLRIVSKTAMPYHGYLVDSPSHREFFNELSLNTLPGCVTAVPIKHGQELVGVLVGIGDESLQKLDVLPKVEAAAAELTATMSATLADAA